MESHDRQHPEGACHLEEENCQLWSDIEVYSPFRRWWGQHGQITDNDCRSHIRKRKKKIF